MTVCGSVISDWCSGVCSYVLSGSRSISGSTMRSCVAASSASMICFCKQKTEYELRISDWSSDVCSSDLCVLTDPDDKGERDYHWGDMWHYAIARMVVAARAAGLRPIDGPFGDFTDPEGFKAQARRAAVLGCEGKWAIHPSQIELANEDRKSTRLNSSH